MNSDLLSSSKSPSFSISKSTNGRLNNYKRKTSGTGWALAGDTRGSCSAPVHLGSFQGHMRNCNPSCGVRCGPAGMGLSRGMQKPLYKLQSTLGLKLLGWWRQPVLQTPSQPLSVAVARQSLEWLQTARGLFQKGPGSLICSFWI